LRFAGRTRAFIKVHDGCDHYCSYCIVAHLRGPMCSRPVEEVLAEAVAFAEAGHREIVLTGIRTGAYDAEVGLPGLLRSIAQIPRIARIRISSIEPMDFTDDLIQTAAEIEQMCPHFHIPLQSGSPTVLRDMRRGYTADEYADLIERIRHAIPGCAFTTDVLVGFPTEGQDDQRATANYVQTIGFSRLHVFPYSPRPGTAAANLADTVPGPERKRRVEEMLQISRDLALAWNSRHIGMIVEVLVEQDGSGYTPDYVRATISGSAKPGEIVRVRIIEADWEGVRGAVEEAQHHHG